MHRRGKNVAALVSLEDLQLIQEIEDRLDNAAAEAALEESGDSIPWERVKIPGNELKKIFASNK